MEIKYIALQELRLMFRRGSKTALMLFGIPVAYGLLFGLVYGGAVLKAVPTVVYDQDNTAASRTVVQAFADSERYEIVAQVVSQEELDRCMLDNTALVAVSIPPNFARDIKLGLTSEVLIETNAVNLLFANTVISTSQEIVQTLAAGTGQKLVEGLDQMPAQALRTAAPVKLGLRITHNPTLSYSNFVLPGLAANGLQLAIVLAACTALTGVYRDAASWRGVPSAVIVAGKLLPYWLCGVVSFLISVLIMTALFQVPLKGSLASLALLGGAFCFAVVSVAGLVSAIAPNKTLAVQMPMLYIMPAFLFSGYSWPQLAMNDFSRAFAATLPLNYSADTMRDIMLSDYAPHLMRDVFALLCFGGVLGALTLAVFVFRRKRLEAAARRTGEVAM